MNDEEKQRNYELAEKLISEQNFAAAVIVGALATLLAAAAYGIIVETWPFSYGLAAAVVGIVIGLDGVSRTRNLDEIRSGGRSVYHCRLRSRQIVRESSQSSARNCDLANRRSSE